jgi:hypothetical protein
MRGMQWPVTAARWLVEFLRVLCYAASGRAETGASLHLSRGNANFYKDTPPRPSF